jgi:hypothetical protein
MTEKAETSSLRDLEIIREGFKAGQAPLKLVTGTQETTALNFDLKPGAIVAHPNSSVIFVCG